MSREPACVSDFEKHAKEVLPKNAWDYYSSGANEGISLRENRRAFDRYDFFEIIPYITTSICLHFQNT